MSGMSAMSLRKNTALSRPAGLPMRTIRPCAIGLRRNATSHCRGSTMSATKLPRPARWRASSLRRTRAPMPCVATCPPGQPSERALSLRRHCVAVVVEVVLGQSKPQVGVGQEFLPGLIDLVEVLALGRKLVKGLECRLVASIEHRPWKLPQLDAGRYQAAQRFRVLGVVFRHHHDVLLGTRGVQGVLVELRQALIALQG